MTNSRFFIYSVHCFLIPLVFSANSVLAMQVRPCNRLLEEDYLSGKTTNKGRTPEEFFAEKYVNGRPRFVTPVGLQGSGKSTLLNIARSLGWKVISADASRVAKLEQMKRDGIKVKLDSGELADPDPTDPKHVYSVEMRNYGYTVLKEQVADALKSRTPFALDSTNVFPNDRIQRIFDARENGFFVEALVFKTSDHHKNLRNVKWRGENGGFDLAAADVPNRDAFRESQMFKIKPFFDAFPIDPSMENVDYLENSGTLPREIALPVQHLKFSDRDGFFAALPEDARDGFIAMLRHEIYNNIEYIEVQDWSPQSNTP